MTNVVARAGKNLGFFKKFFRFLGFLGFLGFSGFLGFFSTKTDVAKHESVT